MHQSLRAPEDIALFRAEMDHWRESDELSGWQRSAQEWVTANNDCRRDILERLRADGPLPSSELPDTCVVPWKSSGWNNNRNLRMMLDLLVQRGEVAAAGGTGRDRLWDLAGRIYPDDPVPSLEEAQRLRDERRLRVARHRAGTRHQAARSSRSTWARPGSRPWSRACVGSGGSIRRYLGQPFTGRAALLSPFDRLLADRKRMTELFEFDYILEMYKPEAKRRWGYYALPILYGDRLVGKLDARADRKAGVLEVTAVHQDEPFSKAMTAAVDREIEDLARWLDLELELPHQR